MSHTGAAGHGAHQGIAGVCAPSAPGARQLPLAGAAPQRRSAGSPAGCATVQWLNYLDGLRGCYAGPQSTACCGAGTYGGHMFSTRIFAWVHHLTLPQDTRPALKEVFSSVNDPAKLLLGGAKFRQELSFDGAHMHPEHYARLVLQQALA